MLNAAEDDELDRQQPASKVPRDGSLKGKGARGRVDRGGSEEDNDDDNESGGLVGRGRRSGGKAAAGGGEEEDDD